MSCMCRESTGLCWLLEMMILRQLPDRKSKTRIFPSAQPVMTRRKRNDRLSTSLEDDTLAISLTETQP